VIVIVAVALYNLGVMDDCYFVIVCLPLYLYYDAKIIVIRDISYTHTYTTRETFHTYFIHAFKTQNTRG